MGLDNSTTDPSRDTVTVTNPNSSCSLRKSRDEPHLPPPSLGKTVLLVWAVGLGTWIVTLDVAPSLGLSTDTLWVDGEAGPPQPDQTQDKANGVRAVHEPGPGSRQEKFCLQTGAHPAPCSAPAPCHQPDACVQPSRENQEFRATVSPDRLQEGSRPLDPCEKCLLVSNPGFTPMLFSAKELKNHVIYTYTSVSIENVCTSGKMALPARWGLLS